MTIRTNAEYKRAALSRIGGNWVPFIVTTLVFLAAVALTTGSSLIGSAVTTAAPGFSIGRGLSFLLMIFVVCPLIVGYWNSVRLYMANGDTGLLANLARISTSDYLRKVGGMAVMLLKVMLWTLLLVIPGIVKAYAYAMTPFILEEYPEISPVEASSRSSELMAGHKFDLFYLQLSFIGWILLGFITFGIGFLWTEPYLTAATAEFYEDLKREKGWYSSPDEQ